MTPMHKTQLGHSRLMSLQALLFGTYKRLDVDALCKLSPEHLQSGVSFIYSFIYIYFLIYIEGRKKCFKREINGCSPKADL